MSHGDDPYQRLISQREMIWGGLKHLMRAGEGQCFLMFIDKLVHWKFVPSQLGTRAASWTAGPSAECPGLSCFDGTALQKRCDACCCCWRTTWKRTFSATRQTRFSLITTGAAIHRHLNTGRCCKSLARPLPRCLHHSHLFESSNPLSAKGFTTLANSRLFSAAAFPRRYLAYTPYNQETDIRGVTVHFKLSLW